MKQTECTTILVGKKATIDGSTMIARSEDGGRVIIPEGFKAVNPEDQPKHYTSVISKQKIDDEDLAATPLRYTSAPDVSGKNGIWGAAGINAENIAMTATETITTNSRIQGVDPLLDPSEGGLGEEDFVTLTLPYLHSAFDGVKRVGYLVEKYGTYEMNGMAFSDKDTIWYLETIGGHHWIARRIPDDAYVIAPNRLNIDEFDFDDTDNFAAASDLKDLISEYHLNPDREGYNMRHIFGSSTIKDAHYNNPRAWYIHNYFDPDFGGTPADQDQPFICHANRLISIEDIKWAESSHYQDTPYDPFGKGTDEEKHRYRPIGLNRTQNAHILQIRSDVPEDRAAIMWLCIGGPTFTPFIPFFANMNDTDPSFNNTSMDYNMNDAWWYYKSFAAIVESHYPQFVQLDTTYLTELNRYFRGRVEEIIKDSEGKSGDELTEFLTKENQKTVAHTRKETEKLWGQMMIDSINMSKLTFNMDENL